MYIEYHDILKTQCHCLQLSVYLLTLVMLRHVSCTQVEMIVLTSRATQPYNLGISKNFIRTTP